MQLSLEQSSPAIDTIQFSTQAVGDDLISTGYICKQGKDVAISITNTGTNVSNGISILVESSREPLVASSSPEVSTILDDAKQIVDSYCVGEVNSPESCVST